VDATERPTLRSIQGRCGGGGGGGSGGTGGSGGKGSGGGIGGTGGGSTGRGGTTGGVTATGGWAGGAVGTDPVVVGGAGVAGVGVAGADGAAGGESTDGAAGGWDVPIVGPGVAEGAAACFPAAGAAFAFALFTLVAAVGCSRAANPYGAPADDTASGWTTLRGEGRFGCALVAASTAV
jgi:hypothetical protein